MNALLAMPEFVEEAARSTFQPDWAGKEKPPIEFERGGHHYSWQFTSSARGDRTHSSAHIFCTLERDGDNVSYQADVHQHGGGQRKFSGGYITLEWKHSLFDRENAQAKIPEAFPELQHQTSS